MVTSPSGNSSIPSLARVSGSPRFAASGLPVEIRLNDGSLSREGDMGTAQPAPAHPEVERRGVPDAEGLRPG